MAHIFQIKGMHCASCAGIIEKTLKKNPAVATAEVNFGNETAKVEFDEKKITPHELSKTIEPLGYTLMDTMSVDNRSTPEKDHSIYMGIRQTKEEKLMELKNFRTTVFSMIPLAAFSIFIMGWEILAQTKILPVVPEIWMEFFHHLLPIFATYSIVVVGKPYLLGVWRFFKTGIANMDTLIGIGTLAAFFYSFIISAFEETLQPFLNVDATYYDVTIVVIAFITLGKYLEASSKIKTGDAIEKLLNLQAKTAFVIRDGVEKEIPLNDVVKDDIILVKAASKIPVDGIVIEGSSYVDESMITGEPLPTEKQVHSLVVAGTMNTTGSFRFRVTKVGSETLLAHIIQMVQEAQGSKAPIQALADKISAVFVPIVLVLSLVSLLLWLFVGSQYLGWSQAISYGLVSFVGILVIACPCALGLATPTAIIVGVGKGAREGILIKDAATLEKLHKVTLVAMDKTGTITKGTPEIVSVTKTNSLSETEIIQILAALESGSEHPIAQAITKDAKKKNLTLASVAHFEILKGKGVQGTITNQKYFAGNETLLRELQLDIDKNIIEKETKEGKTPVFLATQENLLGIVMIADQVKPEAKIEIEKLHKLGIKVVMMTGDNKNTADFIASQVGIDEVFAQVLPADKLALIKGFQATGALVAMIGDGVNDAPALAQADVGIAMATGTDVAIESAGITLLHGDITKIVKAIRLSKMTMAGIKQNLFWAFIYNIVGIPLAGGAFFPLFGWLLNPIFAGLAMAFSSVSVVMNSLRLKTKKL